jgi:beta-glucanase (GH16 family)
MKRMQKWVLLILIAMQVSLFGQCWVQVWSDEFNGTSLDANNWSYDIGNGCPGLCGWGNNEKEYYTNNSNNVSVSGGSLNITARYSANYLGSGSDFTSGKIHTRNKLDWMYGKFEASIKLPSGTGTWPAFWMLPKDNAYGGWPTSGEIDIMEYRGDYTNKVDGTLHYGNSFPNNRYDGTAYTLSSGNFTSAYHLFTVEWEPGEIRWYMDGILYKTETETPNSLNPASNNAVVWPWDKNFYMILNLAVGGWYPGNPSTSTIIGGDVNWTRTLNVDYVRVYSDLSGGAFSDPISGNTSIFKNQSVTYSNSSTAGATYNWSVTGGTIASGQGTNSISVDWATSDGTVSLAKTLGCGTGNFSLDATLQPTHCGTTLEDFENNRFNNYGYINGVLSTKVTNPASNADNTSDFCGKYERNPTEAYDVIIFETPNIGNADAFKNGIKRFAMDVYSNAAGRNIDITLENSATASPTNYPTGRHTTYRTTTTKVNQWETLYFTRISSPDAGTSGASVNRLVLMFIPGTATGVTFYFDNLITDNQPQTANIAGSASFCDNETRSYSVTNTSGSTYAWSLPSGSTINGGSTGNSVSVTFGNTSGTIGVTETNSAGCATFAPKTISVTSTGNCTTDLTYGEESSALISPIPATDKLSIQMKESGRVRWGITDLSGRELLSGNFESQEEISVQGLNNGIYLLTLEQNGIHYFKKVMIE